MELNSFECNLSYKKYILKLNQTRECEKSMSSAVYLRASQPWNQHTKQSVKESKPTPLPAKQKQEQNKLA